MIKFKKFLTMALAVAAVSSLGYTTQAYAGTASVAEATGDTSSNVQIYTGWQSVKDSAGANIWHFYQSGQIVTGDYQVNGVTYHFDSTGKLTDDVFITNGHPDGIKTLSDKTYNGWQKGKTPAGQDTWYYYSNGNKVTGEYKIQDTWYLFDTDGHMLVDTWAVNGKATDNLDANYANSTHYYDVNGIRAEGWCKTSKPNIAGQSEWLHFSDAGILDHGWLEVNKGIYYADMKNGRIRQGWLKVSDCWFHFNNKTLKQEKGWIKDNGVWYYLNPSNGVMKTGWVKDGGAWYFLQNSGAMKTGWQKDGGSWYYLGSNGAMKTGWIKDNGKWYYLYDNGRMAVNEKVGNYHLNANGEWDNQ